MRSVPAIRAATAWISPNEFVRDQLVLLDQWNAYHAGPGLFYPVEPLNGAVWGIWSLAFAGVILVLAKRFSLLETAALAWSIGFVLMWLVIGNLSVLPSSILPIAIPWSLMEAFGAAWVVKRLR